MKDLIFLMGMPGSGKSTFGKKLAAKLDYLFLDLDEYIENKTQKTVSELFSEKGEPFFRELETLYLTEIIGQKNKLVLSLGGGTPCFNNNLDHIKDFGTSIFLDAPIKLLADRILNATTIRPMFKDLRPEQLILKLEELHKNRCPFYKEADIMVNVIDLKLNEVIHFLTKKSF